MADRDATTEGDDGEVKAHQSDHRGAFGEFAGESSGLLDRAFRERIVLVAVHKADRNAEEVDLSLDELAQLVDTAGADALVRCVQRRDSLDPATYVGRGKATEIAELADSIDADTVVFDDELTPAQQYNLELIFKRTALDRTAVILDIFAQNATTLEGKAQVELAQLRYRLPRLRRGISDAMSQQAAGIGTKGPGETQLEIDRRRIHRRLSKLERDLLHLRKTRRTQRKARRRARFHTAALVGYTNAGKSSVLNRLTGSNVLVEDRLFATLDATTRRLALPGGEQVLVSDTVGFIRKLPHSLVQAFKSTLEEVSEVELLLHVVDASAAEPHEQIRAVREVLTEIGITDIDELMVINKSDVDPDQAAMLVKHYEGAVAVCARTGEGFDELVAVMSNRLRSRSSVAELLVPFARGDVVATVHREGEVLSSENTDYGVHMFARLDEAGEGLLADFVVSRDT